MARKVVHQQIYKPGMFGGVVNTTICRRVDNSSDDLNVDGEVTCKHCLQIIARGLDSRLKWIGWKPSDKSDGPRQPA